jgi:hypothetical protein
MGDIGRPRRRIEAVPRPGEEPAPVPAQPTRKPEKTPQPAKEPART